MKYKKDNGIVLENTILPSLTEEIKKLVKGKVLFSVDHDEMTYKGNLVSHNASLSSNLIKIKPVCLLSGDTTFFSFMLGNKNYDSYWRLFLQAVFIGLGISQV